MPFFGTVAERVFWKKNPKHRSIYNCTNLINAALWIFFRTTRSVMVLWIFFQDSRIRVKTSRSVSFNRSSLDKDNWLAPPHLGGPLKFSHATFDTVNEIDGTVKYHGDLIGNGLSKF